MINQSNNRIYDLEERTEVFGEKVICFCKKIGITPFTRSIIDQLIRAATSIGANYMEANGASSKKDFRNKIHICLKETKETQHWLRMLKSATDDQSIHEEITVLSRENQELALIFRKISQTLKKNGV